MRKFIHYALLGTAIIASTLTSCKKDDSSGGGGNASAGSLNAGQSMVKASISGAYSTNYESTATVSMATKTGGLIALTTNKQPSASNLSLDQFIIYLPANIQVGTYKATDMTGGAGIFTYSHTESLGQNPKGWQADPEGETVFNFTVTKASATEIEGTFNGEMSNDNDNTKITASGSFAAKF